MRGTTIFAAFAIAGLAASASHAAISVIGNSTARTCYESARDSRARPSDIRTCTRALTDQTTTGRDRVATHVNRGILHVQNGNYARGIADYDEAIDLDDSEPEAYLNKALAMLHQREGMTEVISLLTSAIDRGTRVPALAYYGRGVAHEMNGDISLAYYDILHATDLDPEWELPARDLARFRVIGGDDS